MKTFWQAFIPLFVAIDVFGVVPLYLGLTEGMDARTRRRLSRQATLAALGVSILFLLVGDWVFNYMNITENDFRIGGGVVLLVMAVTDLLFTTEQTRDPGGSIGVVPLGIPLIMGPAGLATIIILLGKYGYPITLASLLTNLFFVWLVFVNANHIGRLMGKAGAQAFAKVAALFLAGIAVMMIRSGVTAMLKSGG
jgi:multiple antibiotic resistance protein